MRSLALAFVLLATPAAAQFANPITAPQIQANQIQQQQQMQQMQVQQNLQNQQLQLQFQQQRQQQQLQREVQYYAQRPQPLYTNPGIAGRRYVVSRRASVAAQDRRAARHLRGSHGAKRRVLRRR